MNEKTNVNTEDIKAVERQRMADVFTSDMAKGKEATAQALLAKTDLAATDILAILETIPTQSQNQTSAFELAMEKVKNPQITPTADEQEETPDMVAKRIASTVL